MDPFELKKEQLKLASKIILRDNLNTFKTIGGAITINSENKLIASIVICSLPDLKVIERKTYTLDNPLPYRPSYEAYREMPALIEAYNFLENEPDILLVKGDGILHPRKIGLASHLGLALNQATIGVNDKLTLGKVENGKIMLDAEIVGFEVKTREHSLPLYISPGHLVTLGTTLNIIKQTICYPHKLPEPLHLAQKLAKKDRELKHEQKNIPKGINFRTYQCPLYI